MTSGKLQIHSLGLLWLLTTVYIVRVASKTLSSTKRSSTLVIQRPRFAGGLLTIPLDGTVQLIQCSTKEVAHGIIRLQYGPKGKTLVMRAANAFERKKWIAAIVDSLATHRAPNVATPTQTRTWKTVAQAIPRASSPNRVSITQELHATVPRTLHTRLSLHSLDAIKRLADGYDSLAQQWAQVATETRQFNAEISGLRVDPEHRAAHCVVC
ncbi:hypothetical protein PI124_g19025 [Phytophthora idaei]|nr:hypothetical protein PI125_g19354 [Phytophthora idaei]KAG3136375.1 hypothetical protein PI126_g17846 [Phytophthora idaei]KAG3235953.1 hypothetical protein PI124_g19025 [Phytophthora idaei]